MHMLFYAFLKGIVFGASIAAIPGPIIFLIMQRTLAEGALIGILCGLGALVADVIYMVISAIGLTFIMNFLLQYQTYLTLFGGCSLLYLGITTYRKQPHFHSVVVEDKRLVKAWLSTFLLTMTNPITIVSYGIVFAGLGFEGQQATGSTLFVMVGGVAVGVICVIGSLVTFLASVKHKIPTSTLQIINKGAGSVIMGFGVMALMRGLKVL